MTSHGFSQINLREIAHDTMRDYGFRSFFPPAVLQEAENADLTDFLRSLPEGMRDMRDILWSSIDNQESQDLDQLEYCETAPNREIRVHVAIADVDCLVPKSSRVDNHAAHNGTSVYTGIEIFPMLPQRLCNDLTSLKDKEDRLAVVVQYIVRKDGSLRCEDVYRACVRNKAKLIYDEIGLWLEGNAVAPALVSEIPELEKQMLLQREASERLHTLRMSNGALELETIEPKVVIENEAITSLALRKKTPAHLIIENFMIASNQTMMWFLEKHRFPVIQRVLKEPERWEKLVDVARSHGDNLPANPEAKALSDFLARRRSKNPEQFPDLSLTIVKLLGSAEYQMTPPGRRQGGHFGLAVADYIHSTAPNRRYVDLIIQRLIKAVLARKPIPYSRTELSRIATHCTQTAQAAKKAERFMRKVAACVLLGDSLGKIFEGIVTGASSKGTYVRLFDPPAEGRVTRGRKRYEVGEKVRVRLIRLEPSKGFIDFAGV